MTDVRWACEKPCPQHPLDGCSQVKSHADVEHGSPVHVHRLPNETSHLFDDTGRVWGWKDEKHGWPLTASQFHEGIDPSYDPNEPPDLDAQIERLQEAKKMFPDLHPEDGAALMEAMYEAEHRDAGDR